MSNPKAVKAARAIVQEYAVALRKGGAFLLSSVESRMTRIIESEFSSAGEDAQVAQRLAAIRKQREGNLAAWEVDGLGADDADFLLSLVDTAHANGVKQGAEAERNKTEVKK